MELLANSKVTISRNGVLSVKMFRKEMTQTYVFISVWGINDKRKLEYLSLYSDWIDVILFNEHWYFNDGKQNHKQPFTIFYWQVIQEVSVTRQFLPLRLYFLSTKQPTRVSDVLPVYNTAHMPSIRELAVVCCMDVSKNKCGLTRWIRSLSTFQGASQRCSETPRALWELLIYGKFHFNVAVKPTCKNKRAEKEQIS